MTYGCRDCHAYESRGENYCRKCGRHLTASQTQREPSDVPYEPNERFCGHCGGERATCRCSKA